MCDHCRSSRWRHLHHKLFHLVRIRIRHIHEFSLVLREQCQVLALSTITDNSHQGWRCGPKAFQPSRPLSSLRGTSWKTSQSVMKSLVRVSCVARWMLVVIVVVVVPWFCCCFWDFFVVRRTFVTKSISKLPTFIALWTRQSGTRSQKTDGCSQLKKSTPPKVFLYWIFNFFDKWHNLCCMSCKRKKETGEF